MKVNFSQPLIDVRDNSELTFEENKKGKVVEKVLTLQYAAAEALGVVFDDEAKDLRSTEKLKRGLLIQQIWQRPECEISLEEASLIRERIGRLYGPLVVVAAENILDPKDAIKA